MRHSKSFYTIFFFLISTTISLSQFYYVTDDQVKYLDESTNESSSVYTNIYSIGSYTFDYTNQNLIVFNNSKFQRIDWNGNLLNDSQTNAGFRSVNVELIYLPDSNYIFGLDNDSRLSRISSNLDPADNPTEIVTATLGGFAIDKEINKIFYTDTGTNKIMKCDLDGSNVEEVYYLPSGLADLGDIEVNTTNQMVYWINKGQSRIQSCDYNGNNFTNAITGLTTPSSLCINNDILYWIDNTNDQILQHSILTGSTTPLVETFGKGSNLQMNTETEELFWYRNKGLRKMNITTKEIVGVYSSINYSLEYASLAFDPIQQKIFVGEYETYIECNLDGSNSTWIPNIPFEGVSILKVDPISEMIFYTGELFTMHFKKYDELEFSSYTLGGFADYFSNFQIDITNKKLYWSYGSKIHRINYDGTNNEIVFDIGQGSEIGAYFIDAISDKIFYASGNFIYKANLDGTEQTPIINNYTSKIISDPINNRLYYLRENGNIYHTDLDGYFETEFLSGDISTFLSTEINSFNLLPLIMTEASIVENDIILDWTMDENFSGFVTSSISTGNFFIERKTLTEDWGDIGTLAYFEGVSTYSFTDDDPELGLNSYRLRYISDDGGLTSYSKNFEADYLVGVDTELPNDITLWYAHLDNQIKIEGFTGQLNIYNQLGQLQLSKSVNTSNSQHDVSHLNHGIHLTELITDEGTKYAKSFIIVR